MLKGIIKTIKHGIQRPSKIGTHLDNTLEFTEGESVLIVEEQQPLEMHPYVIEAHTNVGTFYFHYELPRDDKVEAAYMFLEVLNNINAITILLDDGTPKTLLTPHIIHYDVYTPLEHELVLIIRESEQGEEYDH